MYYINIILMKRPYEAEWKRDPLGWRVYRCYINPVRVWYGREAGGDYSHADWRILLYDTCCWLSGLWSYVLVKSLWDGHVIKVTIWTIIRCCCLISRHYATVVCGDLRGEPAATPAKTEASSVVCRDICWEFASKLNTEAVSVEKHVLIQWRWV